MRIQLPVETWIEILNWLKRRDLLKKLDKLWDRQFTPLVQDWLHKYTRNVHIGKLWADTNGLSVYSCGQWEKVPIADLQMSQNIKGFKRIYIRYLDSTLLAFFRRMSPIFHSGNAIHLMANFHAKQYELPTLTALRLLMPMFSGSSIESLTLDCNLLPFFSTDYPSTLSNAKLLKIWDSLPSDENEQILIDWLYTRREDGQPRVLVFEHINITGFCKKIRKRFMHAARQFSCPFFVRMWIVYEDSLLPINTPNVENGRTGEQLTFKNAEYVNEYCRLITNCPMNTDVEWLDKKTEEVLEWDLCDEKQVIILESLKSSPQLYAAENYANANQQQQASGSGNKRI